MAFELTKGYIDLTTRTSRFNRAMSGVRSRLASVDDKIREVTARAAKMFVVAAVGYAAMSLKAYASFEEQLAKVSTMLDEATMRYMPQFEKAVKKMAVAFGEGTKTIADGLYDILSASIRAGKSLGVLRIAMETAVAGMTDTRTAADVITTVLNSYSMSADRAGYVSDIMFAIVKRGKTEFGLFAPHIGKVASLAATAGLSLEQLGIAIAFLTRGGMRARIAMSGIKAMLNTIIKSSTASKEARLIMQKYGVSLDTTTLRAIGLTGILTRLKRATVEELAILMPATPAITAFAVGLAQASKQADDLAYFMDVGGRRTEAYEKMIGTAAFKTRQFWQSTKLLARTVGIILGPAYKTLVDALTATNVKMSEFVEKYAPEVSEWAEKMAARINFLRKAFWEFGKFLITDFPEAWKFLKTVVLYTWETIVASLEVIWQKFTLDLPGQLKFVGKSMLTVWEKVSADMVNITKKMLHKKTQAWFEYYAYIKAFGVAFTKNIFATNEDINREFLKTMREYEKSFKHTLKPTKTWGDVGAAQKGFYEQMMKERTTLPWTDIFGAIKEAFKETGRRIAEATPDKLADVWREAWGDMAKKIAEIEERYAKQRAEIAAKLEEEMAAEKRRAAEEAAAGIPGVGAGAGAGVGVGAMFVGLKQAWMKMAEAAAQQEALQVQQSTLEVARQTRQEMHRSNRERRAQLNDLLVEARKEQAGQGALAM